MSRLATLILVLAMALVAPARAHAQGAPALLQESYELEAAGKTKESLGALERIATAERGYVFHLRKGWLLYLLGRYDDSVVSYGQAIGAAPKSIEAELGVMLPLMAQRKWADAEKHGREALKRDPGNYLAGSRVAWSLYNLGRYGDALPLYEKLVESYPSDVDMRNGVGWSLLKLGKGKEAAQAFRGVLAIAPKNALAQEGMRALGVPM